MTRLPTSAELWELAQLSLTEPRQGAAKLLEDIPSRQALWLILSIVIVFMVMIGEASKLTMTEQTISFGAMVVLQGGPALLMVVLIYHVGRAAGGTGSFDGALLVVSWIQFILVFFQLAQVIMAVIMPPAAVMLAIISVGVFFWLLSNFVAELHRFVSPWRVFWGALGIMVPLSLVVVMIAGAMGFDIPNGATQ